MLFARPNDFGWYGAKGKYTPWNSTESHDKFKNDLSHTLGLLFSGATSRLCVSEENALELEEPRGLGSRYRTYRHPIYADKSSNLPALKGKVVLVEFWATWCVP